MFILASAQLYKLTHTIYQFEQPSYTLQGHCRALQRNIRNVKHMVYQYHGISFFNFRAPAQLMYAIFHLISKHAL